MTDDDRIADMLLAWEETQERGESITAEELCRDCPELLDKVCERIRLLGNAGWMKQPAPTAPEKPRTLAERYALEQLIGSGGYAQVWRAYHLELHRHVAVKIPKPNRTLTNEQVDEVLAEARQLARLKHPNIVTVHDVVREGAGFFIVTDLIEGQTLAQRLEKDRMPVAEVVTLLAQVARAIDYAHAQGVVHRDLKPANLFLDRAGQPHVGDFGLARSREDLIGGSDRRGTLAYSSPEQLEGQPLDGRSDIWSLGVILYEMLTGRQPFTDENPMRLRQVILSGKPPALPGVPEPVAEVCLRCLARKPDERFGSGQELAEALERAMRGPPRWGRWLGAGVALCLLSISGLSILGWLPSRSGDLDPRPPVAKWPDEPATNEPTAAPPARDDSSGVLRGHAGGVRCVAVSADGNLVASGGDDGKVRLWPTEETGAPVVLDHDGAVTAVAFGLQGRTFLASTSKGAILCWALPARSRSQQATAEAARVGLVASGFWPALSALAPRHESPWLVRTYPAQAEVIQAVAASPDGRFVAWASKERIEVWEMRGSQPLTVARTPGERVLTLSFQQDGFLIAGFGCGPERKVATLSWQMQTVNDRIAAAPRGRGTHLESFTDVRSITMSSGRDVVLVTQSSAVRVFVRQGQGPNLVLAGSFESPKVALSMTALLPGGRALSVGQDHALRLWATSNQVELATYQGHTRTITGVAASEDGGTAATASEDGTVRLWKTPSFDRDVAERILSLGGEVTVEEQGGDKRTTVRKPIELPGGNFRLSEVDVCKTDQISDEDVDKVQSLTALRSLKLPDIDRAFLLAHTYKDVSNGGDRTGLRIKSFDGGKFTGDHFVYNKDDSVKHHAIVTGTITHGRIRFEYAEADIVVRGDNIFPASFDGVITPTRAKLTWRLVQGNASGSVSLKPEPKPSGGIKR